MRNLKYLAIPIGLIALISIAPSHAGAYSIESGGTASGGINSPDFTQLLSPISNFMTSIGSIGANQSINLPSSIPTIEPSWNVQEMIHNAAESFDAWLYGLSGFHILGLFTAMLNIFSWLLGVVKSVVDWLLAAI